MTGPTHRIFSSSAAWVGGVAVGLPPYLAVGAALVAGATASLPDDVEKPLHLKHRTLSHWPTVQLLVFAIPVLAAALWAAALVLIVTAVAAAAWFGCLMHSCADAMTVHPSGIKLLWPLSNRGFHLMPHALRVRVDRNSASEWAFTVAWCAIVLCFTYARFRSHISA